MKVKTRNILAENELEFTTEIIFQAGGSFFYELQNGGERGAWDARHNTGRFSGPEEISRAQALAKCASWGKEEVDLED